MDIIAAEIIAVAGITFIGRHIKRDNRAVRIFRRAIFLGIEALLKALRSVRAGVTAKAPEEPGSLVLPLAILAADL